jgi:hypothetical protein
MRTNFIETVTSYVRAINGDDATGFIALFTDNAVVDDAGREFRGTAAIKEWSDREIFGAQVKIEVLDSKGKEGETVLTTKVDGNFDRTGLPDPVIITHRVTVANGKIVGLTCRLAEAGTKA